MATFLRNVEEVKWKKKILNGNHEALECVSKGDKEKLWNMGAIRFISEMFMMMKE